MAIYIANPERADHGWPLSLLLYSTPLTIVIFQRYLRNIVACRNRVAQYLFVNQTRHYHIFSNPADMMLSISRRPLARNSRKTVEKRNRNTTPERNTSNENRNSNNTMKIAMVLKFRSKNFFSKGVAKTDQQQRRRCCSHAKHYGCTKETKQVGNGSAYVTKQWDK